MSSFYKKQDNDFFDKSTKWKIFGGVLAALGAGLLIIAIVFALNEDTLKNNADKTHELVNNHVTDASIETEEEDLLGANTLTADQLDFWDIYKEDEENNLNIDASDFDTSKLQEINDSKENKDDADDENDAKDESISENSVRSLRSSKTSDNQYNIGTSAEPMYIDTIDSLTQNTYAPGSFRLEGQDLSYYDQNRKTSSLGIDVSKYQGDIDWAKVKEAGIEYAMIRMGVRGYSTGAVVLDEKYTQNIIGAISHGIDVGIYFYSQATTETEAIEEANYAIAAVQGYAVNYPIVFYSETITTDKARTDDLDADTMTAIAKTFCNNVEMYGYKSMVAGNKSQLSTKMNLADMEGIAIYLIDPIMEKDTEAMEMSDYPYLYNMWQYSNSGTIDGIDGDVNLDISFVDYKYR